VTLRRSNRRGYAMVLVTIFVVLFSAFLGVAWRRVASALRVEHLCEVRKQCDAGSIQVLAQAMQVLETRLCQTAKGVTLAGSDPVSLNSPLNYSVQYPAGGSWYTVTFACTSTDGTQWNVSVVAPPSGSSTYPALPSP
jgi:hypothetical protein